MIDHELHWTLNNMEMTEDKYLDVMSLDEVAKAHNFHRSFPQYEVTPLKKLSRMAGYLGVKSIYVKDESFRFGLNAFKVLGGSYAIGRFIAKRLNRDISTLPYEVLSSKSLHDEFGQTTFFTATDGNHGRGIAWAAKELGQKARVLMPKGTTHTRLENIQSLGAEVTIEDMNYDDCVRKAAAMADAIDNGVIVQDTAWDGYEEIPSWIMQGYGTLAREAQRQMAADCCERPTHVFVQAGVGSLAGAVIGYFRNLYPDNPPIMCVVEASAADCLYKSAVSGKRVSVSGDLSTIMAGLACGESNTIAWDILKNHADAFFSCPDWMSAKGTRVFGVPLKGDPIVISGESGSITMGLLTSLFKPENKEIKEALKLDENSEVLLISTEGNTDPIRFREIVWDGLYGLEKTMVK